MTFLLINYLTCRMAPGYSSSNHDYNKETKEKFKFEYSKWQTKRPPPKYSEPPHLGTDLQSFLTKPKPKLCLSTIDLRQSPMALDPAYTIPKTFLDRKKNYHSDSSSPMDGGLFGLQKRKKHLQSCSLNSRLQIR